MSDTQHHDQLLKRCQQGDEAALAELIHCLQDRIYRLACRVLVDKGLAEEAAGQTFFKVWTRSRQWQGQSSAETWIYRIALRTILDVRRGQRRWWQRWIELPSRPVADARPTPADASAQSEDAARVSQALVELSEPDRALIHLYYFEQRGLAEIEAILNVPRDNLKMRLARARQRLRDILEKEDDG